MSGKGDHFGAVGNVEVVEGGFLEDRCAGGGSIGDGFRRGGIGCAVCDVVDAVAVLLVNLEGGCGGYHGAAAGVALCEGGAYPRGGPRGVCETPHDEGLRRLCTGSKRYRNALNAEREEGERGELGGWRTEYIGGAPVRGGIGA